MKLTVTDKKLLTYLYHHYREPLTEISKACKISRDQVEYRIEKYQKQGVIRKYLAIFDYGLLGYNEFIIVWLKTKNKNIRKELELLKQTISVGDALPEYDLYVNLVFKDKAEFENVFYEFVERHKESITDYVIFLSTYAEFFPLKAFGDRVGESYITAQEKGKVEIDEKESKIIKELENNGRTRIVDIAKKTTLSPELVIYKLKNLHKKGIILGTRIQFDMEKLGFYFGTLNLKLQNKGERLRKKIKSFCEFHKYVNALAFGISEYDCIIQLFYQNENELRESIKEIKKEFKEEIIKSSLILIENESLAKTLPF